jgi:lysophospholipid acyltransferase (LPLAT)-like uncharacterized protein
MRMEIEDEGNVLTAPRKGPYLFAFWHNRLFLTPYIYEKYFSKRSAVTLISRSRDGEIISSIIQEFRNIRVARGSSSRGSVVVREIIRLIKEENLDLSMTPDGPRGPRYQLQTGILYLSQTTGCPIVPVTYELGKKKELKSWDRFHIPYPFTRCRLKFGKPIQVPSDATDHDITHLRATLSDALGS